MMRSGRWIIIVGFAVAWLAGGGQARAQDSGERARQAFEALLRFYVNPTGSGQWTHGPMQLRADGDTTIATMPDVVHLENQGRDRFEMGTLEIARRSLGPDQTRYELRFPPTMRTVVNGREAVRYGSAASHLVVIGNEGSGSIDSFEFAGLSLTIVDHREDATIEIGQASISARQERRPDGRVDYPGSIRLTGATRRRHRHLNEPTRFGVIDLRVTMRGLPADFLTRMRASAEQTQHLPHDRQMQALLDVLIDSGVTTAGVIAELSDVQIVTGNRQSTLLRLMMSAVWRAQTQHNSQFIARITSGELELPPGTPLPGVIPDVVDLNLEFDGLPNAAMVTFLRNGLQFGANPTEPVRARPGAVEALIQTIVHSGLTMRIAPLHWEAPAIGAYLDGAVTPAPSGTVIPINARGTLTLRGLDTLAGRLGIGQGEAAAVIAMVQGLGQQATGQDGRPARLYRFEVTGDGRAILNGADMSALLGLVQQPQQPRRQP